MPAPIPLTRDIVLIGGGHAHALVLRRWGMDPLPGARLTVINPGPTAPYTGMLPGYVAGHYDREALEIDLQRLCRFAGARLILGKAESLDRAARSITITGRGDIGFDIASIDIGIHSAQHDLPGFDDHAVAAKPLGRFASAWAAHLACLSAAPARAEDGLAVIGAGVGGVELAMAMAHGAKAAAGRAVPVTVIDSGAALAGVGPGAARALRQRMTTMGITLLEHTRVSGLAADGIALADGGMIRSGFTVGAAGARPHGWLEGTGLALENGFIRVDASLRSVTDRTIFAVGDCAHMDHAPRPKAGVFAVRQAPVLAANLRAAAGAGPWRRYRPQRDYLKLISLGRQAAVADKFGLRLEGPLLWRWKDRIDRAFMDRLADLPAMAHPPLPAAVADGVRDALAGGQPMCGGCGSKLGRGTLGAVLAGLPFGPQRSDVEYAPMDDAAILSIGGTRQVISTDHLRAFLDDPHIMARIAANHALGDVFAMGAAPQALLATVILPPAGTRLHRRILTEVMAGAQAVAAAAGAQIVGGHTLIGDALSIGFTVTGLATRPVALRGAQAGDALILTKPLGSGVIMAADMALLARGQWVADAVGLMQHSQQEAARILISAGVHSMTDVTGFGLAGHLDAMIAGDRLSAQLTLADIPLMDGAAELAARGQRSTLFDENRAGAGSVRLPDAPEADLLFDPQTAGGLLAALPAAAAGATVDRLRDAGYGAAVIGHLVAGPPGITVR